MVKKSKVTQQNIDLLIRSIPEANIKSFYSRLSKNLIKESPVPDKTALRKISSPFENILTFAEKKNNPAVEENLSTLDLLDPISVIENAGYRLVFSDSKSYDKDSKTFYLDPKGAASLILFAIFERRLLNPAIDSLELLLTDKKLDMKVHEPRSIAAGLFLMHICSEGLESVFVHLSPDPRMLKNLFNRRKDSDAIMSEVRQIQSDFIKKIYGHM